LTHILLAYNPSGCHRAGEDMQDMPVPRQADPHASADAANDPALMALHCVGVDIMGPFRRAVKGYWFLYVTIEKFTKWPKATPVVKISKQSVVKFIKYIICIFWVPNRIVTDNGYQFTSSAFQGYCEDLDI
jgi:hypothetical protein